MHYVWMVVIGLIVGVIARFVHPGRGNMGFPLTIMVVRQPSAGDGASN